MQRPLNIPLHQFFLKSLASNIFGIGHDFTCDVTSISRMKKIEGVRLTICSMGGDHTINSIPLNISAAIFQLRLKNDFKAII